MNGRHSEMSENDRRAARFAELRPLLFTVAYEMVGTAADAEDVLQDSYLRWAEVDDTEIADTKAYLAKIVTRQALNVLRSRSRRREEYVGPWLPEPILTDERDLADDVVLAEAVSTAMLGPRRSNRYDRRFAAMLNALPVPVYASTRSRSARVSWA